MKKLAKKIILFVLISGGLGRLGLHAQSVTVPFTFSGTSPVALQMDSSGDLSSIGTYGTGTFSLSGAGTRMFWSPVKAAFRAGRVSGTQWDSANVGPWSVAFGDSVTASSNYGMAVGSLSVASNAGSIALGMGPSSSGYASFASGNWTVASGDQSTAMGLYCAAIGQGSFAEGYLCNANGYLSFASGFYSSASASYSTAMSGGNAQAQYSVALGQTTASTFGSCSVGTFNLGGGSSTTIWVATDPVFEVGNGTSSSAKSDALIIYKNGSAKLAGPLTIPQSGDIPMYTGN